MFHMLGLYPLPATREFLISSPFFRTVRIRNPLFGTTTTIRTHGFEGMGNVYVKVRHFSMKPITSVIYLPSTSDLLPFPFPR